MMLVSEAFRRGGTFIELSASEYARKVGIEVPEAKGILTKSANAGLATRVEIKGVSFFIPVDMAARRAENRANFQDLRQAVYRRDMTAIIDAFAKVDAVFDAVYPPRREQKWPPEA